MSNQEIPASLNEAILSEPTWLIAWVGLLVLANAGAVLFVVARENQAWKIRQEPIAIIAGFIAAAVIMDWLFANYGYVRLLGLGHLLGWTPAYVFVLMQRQKIGRASMYGKYIVFYLVIAGISLLIDAVDVVRYLLGDGELFMRWG